MRIVADGRCLCELGQGASFGERALVFKQPRTATVETLDEEVKFWCVNRQAFNGAITENMRLKLAQNLDLYGTNVSMKLVKHVRLIGAGSFGSVRLVEHKRTGIRYALKRIRKTGGLVPEEVVRESGFLAENHHPFLLQHVDTFETEKSIYMLTELVTGGQLYEQVLRKMGVLSRKHAQFYIGALALTLECLHERCIVYRDLKPENVMLDQQGYIKLVDFGLAKRLDPTALRTFTMVGTVPFMAPEVIQGGGYSFGCDVWSLGVMCYELVCGHVPFGHDCEDDQSMLMAILEQPLQFPGRYNDACGKKLLQGMLSKEPSNRLCSGSNDWGDIKGHKYFKQGVAGNLFSMITGRELSAPWVPESEEFSNQAELEETITLSDSEELGQEEPMDFGCRLLAKLRSFNINVEGQIDRHELRTALMALDPETFSKDMCDRLFDAMDQGNSSCKSYHNFIAWILDDLSTEDLTNAFRSATKLDAHG